MVDVLSLMEERLPRYFMNCLRAAGYDDLEVIASMDVAEGEKSSCISTIEGYIRRQHKNNPDMLPPCCPVESVNLLPLSFHQGIALEYVNLLKKSNNCTEPSNHLSTMYLNKLRQTK